MKTPSQLKAKLKQLKQQTLTVYFAARDLRMAKLVKLLVFAVAGYALSPLPNRFDSRLHCDYWLFRSLDFDPAGLGIGD